MYIGRTWLHLAAPWQWCVAWQTAGMTARVRGPPPHRSSWDSRGRFRARSCASASASSAPAPAGAASASTASTCARRALHPNQHAHNTSAGLEGAECVEQWSRRASCVMLRGSTHTSQSLDGHQP